MARSGNYPVGVKTKKAGLTEVTGMPLEARLPSVTVNVTSFHQMRVDWRGEQLLVTCLCCLHK